MVELGKNDSEKSSSQHPRFTGEKTDFPRVTMACPAADSWKSWYQHTS